MLSHVTYVIHGHAFVIWTRIFVLIYKRTLDYFIHAIWRWEDDTIGYMTYETTAGRKRKQKPFIPFVRKNSRSEEKEDCVITIGGDITAHKTTLRKGILEQQTNM